MNVRTINPYDGSLIAEYTSWDSSRLQESLLLAESSFRKWRKIALEERGSLMRSLSDKLLSQKHALVELISLEMGKIRSEAIAEIEKCASLCRYYAEKGATFLKEETVPSEATYSVVRYEPLGGILGIMPWNFPFWQVFRYAIPVLMAGNVTLLKHAPNVWGCALAIERLFLEAGFPEGVFQSILIDIDLVEMVIAHPIVQGVTLTGSERAGKSVAMLAGKYGKKSLLELGGSDAFIVLADADVETAAKVAIQSRMANAGQTCIAAKRWIVEESVADLFMEKVLFHVSSLKVGNPLQETTTLAPMARLDLATQVRQQVERCIEQGATPLLPLSVSGTHFQPMILGNVDTNMIAYTEEIFGPVGTITIAKNEQEAIRQANQTPFGLGASLWTKDLEKAKKLASELEVGSVFINAMVRSDARFPFGGVKRSGYGRELSVWGLREFVNIKTVWASET